MNTQEEIIAHNQELDAAEQQFLEEKAAETTNAPEAEISLNPEALKVQYQAQAQAVLTAAVEFIRRQGSSVMSVVDILAYKRLREEVRGFAIIAYELQLETMLTRATPQQPAEGPSPDSASPSEAQAADEVPAETQQA
jgi:hypothetical protein